MKSSRIMHALGVSALALSLAACGGTANNSTSSTPSDSGGTAATTIDVVSDSTTIGAYKPKDATAKVGDTVKWTFNDEQNPHTVDSDSGDPDSFSSGSTPKNKGETFTFTFTKAGAYKYHCSLHASMTGTITIS
jgi:plastocyanin